ncbi:MAG: hypothetical protein DI637_11365 [Citromicrobium sp.]|nr:MAG: hypothetical protein DI637_11365 [Citromicrobium sp.]
MSIAALFVIRDLMTMVSRTRGASLVKSFCKQMVVNGPMTWNRQRAYRSCALTVIFARVKSPMTLES